MEGKKKRVITVVTLLAAVLLIVLMAVFALWYRGMRQDTVAAVSDTVPPVSSTELSSGEAGFNTGIKE